MTNQELHNLLNIDRNLLSSDGRPEYNRLIFSHSPYLLQHAKNPVNWREWNIDTLEEAKKLNIPLFVSIGYATCHWCHVMAHESFEDKEVADLLNRFFVPVKVDREERPDLDEFCMAACQIMTDRGGWPLNCFLKPDATPFYSITYLPKTAGKGMPGFLDLLKNISNVWDKKPEAVDENATSLLEELRLAHTASGNYKDVDLELLSDRAVQTLQKIYDPQFHGFGNAPKFPMPSYLLFLIGRDSRSERDMALKSLKAIRKGGIWDQLAGGIHRYSTDQQWLTPHFEKMLYDQALVAYTALEAYSVTKDDCYLEMAESLIEFVLSDLRSPEGGFYCGLDADTEGVEGKTYIWKTDEINQMLGERSKQFCRRYNLSDKGNFEESGLNILHLTELQPTETEQFKYDLSRLLDARNRREQPLLDLKILSSWNGLMIAALAKGVSLTGNESWLIAANKAAEFISSRLIRSDGRLLRSNCNGKNSDISGFIDDYAFFAWACLELYIADSRPSHLKLAKELCHDAIRLFRSKDGVFKIAGSDAEQIPVSLPESHDGVIPCGSSVLAMNLTTVARITNEEKWQKLADETVADLLPAIAEQPTGRLWLLRAALSLSYTSIFNIFIQAFYQLSG